MAGISVMTALWTETSVCVTAESSAVERMAEQRESTYYTHTVVAAHMHNPDIYILHESSSNISSSLQNELRQGERLKEANNDDF